VRVHRLRRLAAQLERRQRVAERAAHQELHRQVVDAARLGVALLGLGPHPALGQALARDLRDRLHQVIWARVGRHDADMVEQLSSTPAATLRIEAWRLGFTVASFIVCNWLATISVASSGPPVHGSQFLRPCGPRHAPMRIRESPRVLRRHKHRHTGPLRADPPQCSLEETTR